MEGCLFHMELRCVSLMALLLQAILLNSTERPDVQNRGD